MKKKLRILILYFLLFLLPVNHCASFSAAFMITSTAAEKKTYRKTLRTEKGNLYYYNGNGKKVKNTWKTISGKRYYFKSNGAAAKGWTRIKGKLYYFSPKKGVYRPVKKLPLGTLQRSLRNAVSSYRGTWSVYVKNLDTNESFSINNRSMYAASLIKLYAMGAAYQKIKEKKFSESSVYGMLTQMITVSSNYDFNNIVRKVGKTYISKWCRSNGYKNTRQVHGLSPSGNTYGLRTSGGSNITSVKDCGAFLESVYRGTCVSRSYSKKMLSLLKKQERRWKIPAGIPRGVTVANKTGETDNYTHDAAIVYSKGADYILCVMAYTPGSGWSSAGNITKISRIVYNYFN